MASRTDSAQTATGIPNSLLYTALALAAVSAIFHLYIGTVIFGFPQGIALILIALVYLGGIALIAGNYRRALWLRIAPGWVLLLLVLWALTAAAGLNTTGTSNIYAYVDKAVEVVLLITVVRIWMVRPVPKSVTK